MNREVINVGSGSINFKSSTRFQIEDCRVTTYTQTGRIKHQEKRPSRFNFSGKTGGIKISPETKFEINDGRISITNNKSIKLQ